MEEMKICKVCSEDKPITNYVKNSNGNRGSVCRVCFRERKRLNKEQHKEEMRNLSPEELENTLVYTNNGKINVTITKQEAVELIEAGVVEIHNKQTVVLISRKKLREFVLQRDRYSCVYCGEFGDTLEHIIPKADGGKDTPRNLACACTECNNLKGCMSLMEFRKYIETKVREMQEQLNRQKSILANLPIFKSGDGFQNIS